MGSKLRFAKRFVIGNAEAVYNRCRAAANSLQFNAGRGGDLDNHNQRSLFKRKRRGVQCFLSTRFGFCASPLD